MNEKRPVNNLLRSGPYYVRRKRKSFSSGKADSGVLVLTLDLKQLGNRFLLALVPFVREKLEFARA